MTYHDAHDTEAAGVSTRTKIARAVNARLQEAGVSQRKAMALTGIAHSTFVRKINGHAPFDIDELAKIAAVLDVSVAALITYAEHTETAVA